MFLSQALLLPSLPESQKNLAVAPTKMQWINQPAREFFVGGKIAWR
jgi:hypothetical protein